MKRTIFAMVMTIAASTVGLAAHAGELVDPANWTCAELEETLGAEGRFSMVVGSSVRTVYSEDFVDANGAACAGTWQAAQVQDVDYSLCRGGEAGYMCLSNVYAASNQVRRPYVNPRRVDSRAAVRNRSALPGRTYVSGGYITGNGVFHSDDN